MAGELRWELKDDMLLARGREYFYRVSSLTGVLSIQEYSYTTDEYRELKRYRWSGVSDVGRRICLSVQWASRVEGERVILRAAGEEV